MEWRVLGAGWSGELVVFEFGTFVRRFTFIMLLETLRAQLCIFFREIFSSASGFRDERRETEQELGEIIFVSIADVCARK